MGAQEDYESLSELADRLFGADGDPDKRDKWLTDHMKQLGHKAKSIWEDGEPDNGNGNSDGGYFGSGRRAREIRPRQPRQSARDWQYGS